MSPETTTKKTAQKAASSTTVKSKSTNIWSAEEKAAMKARAKELKSKEDGESKAQAAIAGMEEPDRSMAERLHKLIKANAPSLVATTWYGFPAYTRDGKVVCFFQPALKFKTRYAELGFNDPARLDDGDMWPVAYALKKLTAANEAKISALVKKAAG